MRKLLLTATVLVLAACGQAHPVGQVSTSPGATPGAVGNATPSAGASSSTGVKPTAAPSPKTSSTLLFAVLEAKGTANAWTYNTIAISGLDGYARAKTTFSPMPAPDMGCMGAVLPQSAHVAAGKAYFADSHGVVRSLGIDNTVTTVATFPMTSAQQMLSFAVSPDGKQVAGAIFTTPKPAFACNGASSGTFTFDAYRATSPTTSALVYHQSWTAPPQNVMALAGWDAVGPFGTYPTVWASQGGGPASTLGVFVRIDPVTLKPGAPFSDPTQCEVWNSVSSGAFVCTRTDGTASVRGAGGAELWKLNLTDRPAESAVLAPDAQHVALSGVLAGHDGSRRNLPTGLFVEGWLDSGTMVGTYNANPTAQPPFDLSFVALNAPGYPVSMGFTGLFVGTVRA